MLFLTEHKIAFSAFYLFHPKSIGNPQGLVSFKNALYTLSNRFKVPCISSCIRDPMRFTTISYENCFSRKRTILNRCSFFNNAPGIRKGPFKTPENKTQTIYTRGSQSVERDPLGGGCCLYQKLFILNEIWRNIFKILCLVEVVVIN
jgi:hypothetical protein